jgi:DNA polymerase-3 subunit gamma/tau
MTENDSTAPYLVLARKYRPANFAGLVGQEAMVRTLTNAIVSGRLAHAFILTGVRGVGKTTTARIIARALNCVGPDGKGGPTAEPCGVCEHCRAIAEDRHVDVIEMDAASRTGVDDVRELIEVMRYRPVSARYKIYIIDEVHMLSKQAFNALLKTLEEPPEHVKFIFATTEIRRVPVTVLSRCQRFDLRRVEFDVLSAHLADIARRENVAIAPAAIALIARAADGSVRDGLSLLDTAIAHGLPSGGGDVAEDTVREMLGLADRSRVVDLFERLVKGEIAPALALLQDMYASGADPAAVLQDLLDHCHLITRLKVVGETALGPELTAAERTRGREMAEKLAVASLARIWQMLLKGLGEVNASPAPLAAAEMALVRLAYAAELPAPAELVRRLSAAPPVGQAAESQASAPGSEARPGSGPVRREQAGEPSRPTRPGGTQGRRGGPAAAPREEPAEEELETVTERGAGTPAEADVAAAGVPDPRSFEEVVGLFEAHREGVLHAHLVADVHLVRFEPGRIEFRPGAHAPANLANRLGDLLGRWTGRRWVVSVSHEEGELSLKEQADRRAARLKEEAAADPLVRSILEAFPGAVIEDVRETGTALASPRRAADGDELGDVSR